MSETGPVTKAMLDAIYAAYPRICRDLGLDAARSRKMLRIEATYAVETALHYESEPAAGNSVAWAGMFGTRDDQPDTLHGVAVYFIRANLPEPGWRLINPLEHDRPLSPAVQTPAERRFTACG
jgi:hypothetical protein